MTIGGGEAADQMVHMMLSGGEVAVRLGGSALKNLLALTMALAQNRKALSGKVNMERMLQETRDLRLFPMSPEQYKQFQNYVDESEWTIFENTHAPIIDQETFDNVQRIRGNVKRYPDGWGEAAPLTGLMYCADCGGKMYVHHAQ